MKEHGESDHETGSVCVWETADSAVLPVVESVLDAAGIPFVVQGEESLGMLPMGGVGGPGSSFGKGIVARVLVPEEHADEARALIGGTAEAAEAPGD